jgi:hypothetical protein
MERAGMCVFLLSELDLAWNPAIRWNMRGVPRDVLVAAMIGKVHGA